MKRLVLTALILTSFASMSVAQDSDSKQPERNGSEGNRYEPNRYERNGYMGQNYGRAEREAAQAKQLEEIRQMRRDNPEMDKPVHYNNEPSRGVSK
jgi:hypothetical protein